MSQITRKVPSGLNSDAVSTGESQNESTPPSQRVPDRITEVGEGPRVGEKGEYLPARYNTIKRGTQEHRNIREDR